MAAVFALLSCAILAQGCARDKGTDRFQPLYDKFGEVALAGNRTGGATYVFNGFSARRSGEAGLVNKLAAGMLLVSNEPAAGRVSAMGRLALRGDKTENAGAVEYEIGHSMVRSGGAHFFHGETSDIEIRDGEGELNLRLDLPALGLPPCAPDRVAVFVRGFYFDTSRSRANGYPLRRIAVEILNPAVNAQGKLSFTARMELRTDKPGLLNRRKTSNLITGKVLYTVAAAPEGRVFFADHAHALHGMDQAPKSKRVVKIQGARDYPSAFAATQSFSLDLGKRPFKLRALTFMNRGFDYDPESGLMSFVSDASADNTAGGALVKKRRFKNQGRAQARFVLVQMPGGRLRVSHGAFKGSARNGFAEHSALSFTRTFTFTAPAAQGADAQNETDD